MATVRVDRRPHDLVMASQRRASGNESHNGVDPSMSVNRNVTVPDGVSGGSPARSNRPR